MSLWRFFQKWGGIRRPFGIFPIIHPIWRSHPSLTHRDGDDDKCNLFCYNASAIAQIRLKNALSTLVRTIILGFSHQQRQIFLSILWSGRKTVFLAGCLTSGRIKRGGGHNGWGAAHIHLNNLRQNSDLGFGIGFVFLHWSSEEVKRMYFSNKDVLSAFFLNQYVCPQSMDSLRSNSAQFSNVSSFLMIYQPLPFL